MQRVPTLLQKLTELSGQGRNLTAIDIDLMLDYTRVLYADLLEVRKTMPVTPPQVNIGVQDTPTTNQEKPVVTYTEIHHPEVPTYDIRTQIGVNDKYLFLSELFGDDRTAYDNAINQLNKFSTAADAISWVERELQPKYNWDKEHETVQSFYNLLNSSFPSI